MLFKPGLSQIACRFISSPDANLECQVRDDKLVWSLGGRSSEDVPYENWPKLYGVFTDECMRVSSRFYRKNDVVGDGVHGSEVREYENVFFVKYKYYR